jgi:hypothetical protein
VQITRALRVLVDDHMDGLMDYEDKEEPQRKLMLWRYHYHIRLALDIPFLNRTICFFDDRKQD